MKLTLECVEKNFNKLKLGRILNKVTFLEKVIKQIKL